MADGAWGRPGGVLRVVTAGSVDDGKSTLIGRLLLDSKSLMRDQIDSLSRARTGANAEIELAHLVDGLEAEREQGITIDVAYRYFATPRRTFILADAPGHEQYTRNMVTGASTADVAVVLIDAHRARTGQLLAQTRRHIAIAALLGLDVIAAVNKIDLVGFDVGVFEAIRAAVERLARALGISARVIPLSARSGENVVSRSDALAWWDGPTLLSLLETTPARLGHGEAFRFPVQRVVRYGGETAEAFRGYAGRVEAGRISVGDEIEIARTRARARIEQILTFDGPRPSASAGRSVTLQLDRELDVSRGDMIGPPALSEHLARSIVADLCWLADEPYVPGRRYILKHGTSTTAATISEVLFVRDPAADLQKIDQPNGLRMNDLARVRVSVQHPIVADAYADSPSTGSAILIDPFSSQTTAALMFRPQQPSAAQPEWTI